MGILSWLVFGGLAGWVGSILMKKDASMGIVLNIIVGISGALIGGFLMSLIGGWAISGFNLKSFLVAVGGSVVLLAVLNLLKKGRLR
jgi:uncharacterized membrane protein YeaQ/YmgE (transglycosylase-associated protein family)